MTGCPRCGSLDFEIKVYVYKEGSFPSSEKIVHGKRKCNECKLEYEK
jgi:hypothetical protein